jgi:GNAT superfamily N-acetyltransferase
MSTDFVYGEEYQETLTLRNGQRVLLRTVRPEDKHYLVQGLHRLSPASRRARFLATKQRLTEAELIYLTEVDHINHFAIGAVALREDGSEGEGVGIGRFVRLEDQRDSAEPAITVLDMWQGNGLGRILLERLIAAARERGIRTFHAEFLAENEAIRKLLQSQCPDMLMQRRGPIIIATMPIGAGVEMQCDDTPGETLHRLLRLAAQRLIHLRTWSTQVEHPGGEQSDGETEPAES